MVKIIESYLGMVARFINEIFLFQIEWEPGQMVPIGKVVLAFVFIITSLYLIFDAFGLIGGDE